MNRNQRQSKAADEFVKTLDGIKDLRSSERAFEILNFADWMESCDTCDQRNLDAKLSFLRQALKTAGGSSPEPVYVLVRRHFLKYAEAAQCRRFDVIPF